MNNLDDERARVVRATDKIIEVIEGESLNVGVSAVCLALFKLMQLAGQPKPTSVEDMLKTFAELFKGAEHFEAAGDHVDAPHWPHPRPRRRNH
jgi:hypothetical protein